VIQLDRLDTTALSRVRRSIRALESVLVAYSGGVDSSLLLKLALEELGPERARAALASSPAYPAAEQQAARDLARSLGARLIEVDTHEVELRAYRENRPDRCFHCKEELFETLAPIQAELGLRHLAYGATADDVADHRPGHASAVRRQVRFPLLEAGLDKAAIRAAARELGLPNWDKPSFACLSSRVPHGTEVTPQILARIGAAEAGLLGLGFRQVRVRHHGEVARIEVAVEEMARALNLRQQVVEAVVSAGYTFVALDLQGYATGSLNRTWKPQSSRTR